MAIRKRDEFNNMLEAFLDDPQASANHLVLGMSLEQRREAQGRVTGKGLPTWR